MSVPRTSSKAGEAGHESEEDDAISQNIDDDSDSESSTSSLKLDRLAKTTSVVQYLGPSASYCGYCKQRLTSSRRSYDMQAYRLKPSNYQVLLDRNWRRSGTYCYCPINQTTCCPNYPIICKALDFKLTRSQRKCIAKMNSYLATGNIRQSIELDFHRDPGVSLETVKKKIIKLEQLETSSKARAKRYLKSCQRQATLYGKTPDEALKDIRTKWDKKLRANLPVESYLYPKKVMLLKDDVKQESFKPKHSLKIELVYVTSNTCKASRKEQHQMLIRYQQAVHQEVAREWTMSRFCNFLVKTPLVPSRLAGFEYASSVTSIDESEELSVNVTQQQSDEYLLFAPPSLPEVFGTYHCNYYLDNKLIATGVLDVLPKCITTVYFFYDPDYDFLNLGIYSALIEISLIRRMDKYYAKRLGSEERENQLVNYYLGYYVHECKKMHYKTRFRPAYLLCSKGLTYVPIDVCLKKLVDKKYDNFSETQSAHEENQLTLLETWFSIPILPPASGIETSMRSYIDWLASNLDSEYLDLFLNGYLASYAKLIGPTLLVGLTMRLDVVHQTLIERYKRLTRAKLLNKPQTLSDQG